MPKMGTESQRGQIDEAARVDLTKAEIGVESCVIRNEFARDEDGDGHHEVHVNT